MPNLEPVEEPAPEAIESREVIVVHDLENLPPHLDPKVLRPTRTCPKGHTAPSVSVIVLGHDQQELANEPYCAVCFAQYLSQTFPVL